MSKEAKLIFHKVKVKPAPLFGSEASIMEREKHEIRDSGGDFSGTRYEATNAMKHSSTSCS
jgi:hypothetical protein